jgi:hypothetical protein
MAVREITIRVCAIHYVVAVVGSLATAACGVYDPKLIGPDPPAQPGAMDLGESSEAGGGGVSSRTGSRNNANAPGSLCAGSGAASGTCPDCCTRTEIAGQTYHFCPKPSSWADARARCMAEFKGDLARLSDATQAKLLAERLSGSAWIGHRLLRESLWIWSDNDVPFWRGDARGQALFGRFADWADAQPQTPNACGELRTNARMGSAACSDQKPFLCQVHADSCPNDANKSDPGQCGCGMQDTDADKDGIAVCNDACDDNPNKPSPDACGCQSDADGDADGVSDCNDACPGDKQKTAAGQCGCSTADVDGDSDGVADCHDACPRDAQKQAAGQCGCGVADNDIDGDRSLDCKDACPREPMTTGDCFPFAVSNVDPKAIDFNNVPSATLNCGTTTIDTTANPATLSNWCGSVPKQSVRKQNDGPDVVVFALHGLNVAANNTLSSAI